LKRHLEEYAKEESRPFEYLEGTVKRATTGRTKEQMAKEIAERDGLTEGLVCIFRTLEMGPSFELRYSKKRGRYEPHPKRRKCLHYYIYRIDPEFGLMHIRIQSWFPMQVQIYLNGREWLVRRLEEKGISYRREENKIVELEDPAEAEELFLKFAHRRLGGVFNQFLRKLNPTLCTIQKAGFGGYYWVIDQCEVATDLLFRDRRSLEQVYSALLFYAIHTFGSEDVMRFLGRQLHGNFKGDVTSDLKRRREGWRVKHGFRRNTIKMYDFHNLLRIETTVNNPSEFRIPVYEKTQGGRKKLRWKPMRKGVANLWHYAQNGWRANLRYLESLAHAQPKGEVIKELDDLCRSKTKKGRRFARLQPLSKDETALFAAVLDGDHLLHGFRNKDIVRALFTHRTSSRKIAKKRSAKVFRLLRKLRGHRLLRKVRNARRYRVTKKGRELMSAAILTRNHVFTEAYTPAA